jgi:hypothetical protein
VETLLPCRIPNLQLDLLASQLNCFDFEVNADGGDEGPKKFQLVTLLKKFSRRLKCVVTEAVEDTCLSHTRIADQKELEQQIVPEKSLS